MSDKLINEKVDFFINKVINEKEQNLSEGVISSILSFLGFGLPKHRQFRSYLKLYNKCVNQCNKTYESEKTTYSGRNDAFSDLDQKTKEKDLKKTEKMDSEIIKNNPELGKCLTRCRLTLLRKLVDLIEKEGDKICQKNVMTDTCKKWIEKNLPDLQSELEYLEDAVVMLDKTSGNEKRMQNILKKLNKNMYSK